MADPILPASAALVTPAIDAIVASRPEALSHFNDPTSGWAALPAMWRAQFAKNLSRLGDEVKGARLRSASGDALRQLAASEFNTVLPSDPQPAYATIYVQRTVAGSAGVIRKGTIFVQNANPSAQPLPIKAATYETVATTYVPSSGGGTQTLILNAVAQKTGTDANVVDWSNWATPNTIQPAQPLFDSNFSANIGFAGGGSSGLTDPVLRAAARAYAQGQYGPSDGAIIAGILQQQSVRHFAAFRAGVLPYAQVFVTDESWGYSNYWLNRVWQSFNDNWQGFGCRVRFGYVINQQIALAASITLATTDALNYTDAIDANVRRAAESYFNDRLDWYRWHATTLQAVLSNCDPRILQCTSVSVTDAVTGASVSEPTNVGQTWNGSITHFYLTDQAVTTTYSPPS